MQSLPRIIGVLALASTFAAGSSAQSNILYIETNDTAFMQNAVLAYTQNPANGSLTELPGSPFFTGGTGNTNPKSLDGVNDSDDELDLSPDGKRLFAINSGSNTIAVFDIQSDGSLEAVPGSPFFSGGICPFSVAFMPKTCPNDVDRLYVANGNQDFNQLPNNSLPNYSGFEVRSNGQLVPLPGSRRIVGTGGSAPQQVLPSNDGRFLFGVDLFAVPGPGPVGLDSNLHVFNIAGPRGPMTLIQTLKIPDTTAPNLPINFGEQLLGLQQHPTQRILYVGFVGGNFVGVYTFDDDGMLKFEKVIPNSGGGTCWLVVNKAGTRMYTSNNLDTSASVYDITNPMQPVQKQLLFLKEPGPPSPGTFNKTVSAAFQIQLDPQERFFYQVTQRATTLPVSQVSEGNNLHIMRVLPNGCIAEDLPVLKLPVSPATARPQGLRILSLLACGSDSGTDSANVSATRSPDSGSDLSGKSLASILLRSRN